ncbi:MAG: beta-galactosidase [Chloroflexota bacterium]
MVFRPESRGPVPAWRFALVLVLLLTTLPLAVVADEQGVIGFPVDEDRHATGNPYVRGIASHAWWLDPEVYGDQLFPALDDLQVTTVRLSIDWRRFEPEPGVYDWGMYDRVLGELAKRNIVVIATFNTIPGWASVDQEGCDTPITEIQACELREDMYPQFEAAMEAAVSRYAWIEHWEFWNEPEMWRHLGEDGPTYLRHLRMFYDIAHRINPEITVAAQTLVGADYMDYIYNLSEAEYGDGNEPWDAISIHPYNFWYTHDPDNPLEINYDRVRALRDLMVERGDGDQKIWITEYGWANAEEHQARNLPAAMDWMQQQPYIEFAHLHMLHDWNDEPEDQFGLMAIPVNEDGYKALEEDTEFVPKELYYNAFKNYPTDTVGRPPAGEGVMKFSQTGHSIEGRFLDAWEERGGLANVGLPLTRPYTRQSDDGTWRLVQDFERARLEFHPENVGQPAEVQGALVGRLYAERQQDNPAFERPEQCETTGDRRCFEATGFSVEAGFLDFWESRNGEVLLGYPISQEFVQDGRTVQYFERGRLEWNPELGPGNDVTIGNIVRDLLIEEGYYTPEGNIPPDPRVPTRPAF